MHVLLRAVGEVVADLVAGHPALRAGRAQECTGERAGPDARLEDARAREDVGEHEDRAEVLRIDDLRTARHLQHVLGERRPHRDQARATRRADRETVVAADDAVVLDDAGVRVELAAGLERDQVPSLLVVDEEHPVAFGEPTGHAPRSGSIGSGVPVARARSRQNAHRSPGVGAPHVRQVPRSARSSAASLAKRSYACSQNP